MVNKTWKGPLGSLFYLLVLHSICSFAPLPLKHTEFATASCVLASVATNAAGKCPEISATISSGETMSRTVAPLLSTLLFHILSCCDIELIVYILIWNMLFSCTLSVTCRNVQCQHFGCSLCWKSFSRTTGVLQSPHMISWDPDLLFLQYMIYTPPPYSTSFSSWGHFNSTLFDPSKQLRKKNVFRARCPLDY